ncbi:hypothetical protein ACFVHB_10920 [Kitasatospora sp. NPDC127111]|uniref:hypothetical protein n=1 Tax=Kitasatospora sp. NPDC127111 TaxID=3345363 RepID=UPI003643FF54
MDSPPMDTPPRPCRAHGPGLDPAALVGRRLTGVVAAWHVYEGRRDPVPVDVWLVDDSGGSTRVSSGTDWCLVVEASAPYEGYDMDEWGLIEVEPGDHLAPFARHLGEPVRGAREEFEPMTGRIAIELDFPSGGLRCESRDGDVLLRALGRPEPPGAARGGVPGAGS